MGTEPRRRIVEAMACSRSQSAWFFHFRQNDDEALVVSVNGDTTISRDVKESSEMVKEE
jgi:hypothetical protein